MKKLLLIASLLFFASNAMAMKASLFSYDHANVEKALISATVLDNYITVNHVTADQITVGNPLIANFMAENDMSALGPDAPLGIPGFCWGFVLGWVGILIVYLVSEDKQETQNALFGCIIGSIAWVGCYFLLIAGSAGATATTAG